MTYLCEKGHRSKSDGRCIVLTGTKKRGRECGLPLETEANLVARIFEAEAAVAGPEGYMHGPCRESFAGLSGFLRHTIECRYVPRMTPDEERLTRENATDIDKGMGQND